jgi:hypothetical protein
LIKYNQGSSIFGALRRCWSRHPRKRAVLDRARHPTITGPRGGKHYICAKCGKTFGQKDVAVNHISAVTPLDVARKDMSWDETLVYLNTQNKVVEEKIYDSTTINPYTKTA